MIDKFGGVQGDEQFLDEQSFNQELLLMKLDVGLGNSPAVGGNAINQTQSTHANTNSHKKASTHP